MTVTGIVPGVAFDAIVSEAVSCVEELKAHELTVTPLPKLHVAPLRKLLPDRVTLKLCPTLPEFGDTDVSTGGGVPPV